jgi:YHS domain-containing protein
VIRYLLIAIVIVLLARAFWRLIDGIMDAAGGPTRRRAKSPAVKLVRDPICGTYVAPGTSRSLTARGATHYFCSEHCQAEFERTRV